MASSPGALMAHCLPLLLLLYVTRANAAATPIPPSASSSIKHNTNLPQEIQSSTSTPRSKKESATTPMNSASIIEETEVNTKGPINQRLNRQGKRKNVSALKIPSAIDNHKSKEDMYRNSKFEDSSPNRTRAIFETDSKNKMEEMNTTLSNSTKFGVLQNLGLPPRPRRHPKTTIVPNLNLNKTFSNLTSTQIPLVTTQSKSEGSNSTLRDTRSTISLEAVTSFSTPSDQESYVNVTLEVEDERFDRESELNLDSMFISNTYPTSTVQTDVESQLTTECALGTCRVKDVSSTTSPMETQTQCGDPHAGACSARNVSETVGSSTTVGPNEVPWPIKMAAELPGDLILGGLMMVHEREEEVTCGPVMPQGGVQALEAMLYTLDVLNADPALIPNVTLGAHILDDCDKDTYGLEMAVDFIKGSISNIDDAEYHCNKTQVRKVISGVVGAASSVTSIQVANLLRLFRIPQVSFFSTSPELSNKQRFEFFTRTIPSDHYQVKAMVEIVRLMQWNYVSILYEESNYGIKAFEELETLFAKYNVCIAVKEKLVKDSGVAQESGYNDIVNRLLTKPRARGVIIFGSDQEVAGVMRAVRRVNATGAFYWIGSDGWSARSLVSDGNEREVEGTLSVQPRANPVRGFREYFLNLTVENNRRNPWFVEFWEDHFQCRYPNSSRTPYNVKYMRTCAANLALSPDNTEFEAQLQFVSDAVMAFGHAFKDMHRELCAGKPGLCEAMKPIKGTELLKYLRKVTFEGLSGDHFHFDHNGDGPARYNIIHFRQMSRDHYQWVRVGEYTESGLELNMSEVQFRLGQHDIPESVCSLPCQIGQAKKYVEGESCCWHCFNCTQYQIRHPEDETQCVSCPLGQVPDETRQRCRDIPEVFLRPESGWAIGAMAFSATGALVTLFVCGVFARHHDTPVVRASGRELSYVLLTGILLCYCVTFALVLRPTDVVCGVQRFGAGFCFTVVYAALLTKTNRIARIFNAGKRTAKRPSFISPKSQLFICSGLVGVQVLINGVWILVSPPRAVHHHPTREDNHLVCSSHIDASYMIAFGYPILLIVICTVYAVLTRKIPEAFNESKHIGFTMYTTCVIWLAFVPLYFGTSSHVPLRITSMSVTISLSASVTLACLFSPKLYIIIVRPERNVRQSMMPVRYSAIKSPGVTGTAQTGSMMAAVVCPEKPSLGPPSSAHSEGVDVELREDVVHQLRRAANPPPRLLVNRSTQTAVPASTPDGSIATGDAAPTPAAVASPAEVAASSNGPAVLPSPAAAAPVPARSVPSPSPARSPAAGPAPGPAASLAPATTPSSAIRARITTTTTSTTTTPTAASAPTAASGHPQPPSLALSTACVEAQL